jgi:outer membrane protein assembly factor BamB
MDFNALDSLHKIGGGKITGWKTGDLLYRGVQIPKTKDMIPDTKFATLTFTSTPKDVSTYKDGTSYILNATNIIKISSLGDIIWQITAPTNALNISVDNNDGALLVVATSSAGIYCYNTNNGSQKWNVATPSGAPYKVKANMAQVHLLTNQKTHILNISTGATIYSTASTPTGVLNDISFDKLGNTYICSNTSVMKYDSTLATLLWTVSVPTSALQIIADDYGNSYIKSSNLSVSRVNSAGRVMWTSSLVFYRINQLKIDAQGNLIVAGQKSVASVTYNDVWKFGKDGVIQFEYQIVDTNPASPFQCCGVDDAGNIYVARESNGYHVIKIRQGYKILSNKP